jgi:glycogen debranching enzyme
MRFGERECRSERFRNETEWLETDGTGSYAAGTVAFGQTRKYHGLLVLSDDEVAHRHVLVNGLEEYLERAGELLPISTTFREGGTAAPEG